MAYNGEWPTPTSVFHRSVAYTGRWPTPVSGLHRSVATSRTRGPINQWCSRMYTPYRQRTYSMHHNSIIILRFTDDDCTDHFSDQQMARMHCYIDMVYQSVQKESHTTPLPLAPRVSKNLPSWVVQSYIFTMVFAFGSVTTNCYI